ncbi:MAG: RNA 2',3'-cyclic phosphodiesterase [Beijerinckiaceae bacterium]
MPRLFTGLQIPDDIAGELSQFRGGIPGARWIEPDDYHITLRFIGDIGVALAREIDSELAAIDRESVIVTIEGLDSFGGAKPRAIIARIRHTRELTALQADNERAIRRAGGPLDSRKFSPHVTIGRLRNATPPQLADYFHARSIAKSWSFVASEFVLFSARDSVGGGPYHVEAAYRLRMERPALRPAASQ